jgi:hypothetical protein
MDEPITLASSSSKAIVLLSMHQKPGPPADASGISGIPANAAVVTRSFVSARTDGTFRTGFGTSASAGATGCSFDDCKSVSVLFAGISD